MLNVTHCVAREDVATRESADTLAFRVLSNMLSELWVTQPALYGRSESHGSIRTAFPSVQPPRIPSTAQSRARPAMSHRNTETTSCIGVEPQGSIPFTSLRAFANIYYD